jgi:adhesin transport system outer membrane protein
VLACLGVVLCGGSAHALSIEEAITRTVRTNPVITESAANRRAVDQELRATQGILMPQATLRGDIGLQRLGATPDPVLDSNERSLAPGQIQIIGRQLLFDGFSTANEVFRQASRAEAAGHRTLERSMALANDAAEVYIDLLRQQRTLELARVNIQNHTRILGLVDARVGGGTASRAELDQAQERIAAARVIEADVGRAIEDARARFRRIVGVSPQGLIMPRGLRHLPRNREAAIQLARGNNPAIRAALAETDAANFNVRRSEGASYPTVAAEVLGSLGRDQSYTIGPRQDITGRLVMSWSLYDGGTIDARRREATERLGESWARTDVIRRQVDELTERAWIARVETTRRIGILRQQAISADRTVDGYLREYEGGRRSLIDVLNAEAIRINVRAQLVGSEHARLYADYQLAAVTGTLLSMLNIAPPAEALSVPLDINGQPIDRAQRPPALR